MILVIIHIAHILIPRLSNQTTISKCVVTGNVINAPVDQGLESLICDCKSDPL